MGPKGVFLSSRGRWNPSTTSSASCWSRACWLGAPRGSCGGSRGGSCCGGGGGGGGSGSGAWTGGANSRGGDGACAGGVSPGGGDGASLRSMTRCGGRSMTEWGSGSRSGQVEGARHGLERRRWVGSVRGAGGFGARTARESCTSKATLGLRGAIRTGAQPSRAAQKRKGKDSA